MSTIHRTLVMPVPTSKNVWQRIHWAHRGRIKDQWETSVWAQVNERPRCQRPVSLVTAHLDIHWDKPGPLPDFHNLDMAHECVADGLVKAGILADDAGGVYMRGTFKITRVPAPQGNTIVTLDLQTDG